jgi:hypothetical protein
MNAWSRAKRLLAFAWEPRYRRKFTHPLAVTVIGGHKVRLRLARKRPTVTDRAFDIRISNGIARFHRWAHVRTPCGSSKQRPRSRRHAVGATLRFPRRTAGPHVSLIGVHILLAAEPDFSTGLGPHATAPSFGRRSYLAGKRDRHASRLRGSMRRQSGCLRCLSSVIHPPAGSSNAWAPSG